MFKSILVTESRSARRAVVCDCDKCANDDVDFDDEHESQCVVVGMVDGDAIVGLKQLVSCVL